MKHFFLLLFLFITATLIAQDKDTASEDSKRLSKKEIKNDLKHKFHPGKKGAFGFYLGTNYNYGLIADEHALILGGRLGFIVNHHLALGFAARGIYSPQEKGNSGSNDYFATGGYGGFFVEPILFPSKIVHLTFPVSLGAGAFGGVTYDFEDEPTAEEEDWDLVIVLEPGINIEYKAANWIRIGAEANYRLVGDHQIDQFKNGDFDGFSAGICLKIGWFGKK